jgi:hypothetical protein
MDSIFLRLVLAEKKALDLWMLTRKPEEFANLVRIPSITLACDTDAFENNKTSSAKNKWERRGPFLDKLTGFQTLLSTACKIACDRLSMHMTNRYGDRGSPCLRPLVGENEGRR